MRGASASAILQPMRAERGEDRLGERAVARGWLQAGELSCQLAELEERRRRGERVSLGRHLVERGLVEPDQVRELLDEQEKQVMVCSSPRCGRRFNIRDYRLGNPYRCKLCGSRLAVPAAGAATIVAEGDEAGDSATLLEVPGPDPDRSAPTRVEAPEGGTILDEASRAIGRPVAVRLAGTPAVRGRGLRFGRYVQAEEMARGGMGAVYRAVDPELGRLVAIKVILSGDWAGSEEIARFLREAQVTGQLQHPNIPPLHELSRTPDGRPYFAMKLIEGKSLARILEDRSREGPAALAASRDELLGALVKVCDALAYAHSRGVIHRDLKPANIMVGSYGEVLVMDWGIARILGTSERASRRGDVEVGRGEAPVREVDPVRTVEGAVLGTPAYMSPEQLEGRIEEIDARSDVYGLGVVLYEVLTGTRPYDARSLPQILERVLEGKWEPPSRKAPEAGIPAELDRLVEKAMAPGRGKRYRDAVEVGRELEAYLAGRPLAAVRYSAWARAVKWTRRNRGVAAFLGAVTVLVPTLAIALVLARAAARERDEARRQAETALEGMTVRAAVYEDLAASQRYLEEERALWPAVPERVAAMQGWPSAWRRLARRDKSPRTGAPRNRSANFKERIVEERGFKNLRLQEEHVAEFPYTPVRSCELPYRMVVVELSRCAAAARCAGGNCRERRRLAPVHPA